MIDSATSLAFIEDAEDAIIAKSLNGTVTSCSAGAERGMNDFLTKPCNPVALVAIVRRHLDLQLTA